MIVNVCCTVSIGSRRVEAYGSNVGRSKSGFYCKMWIECPTSDLEALPNRRLASKSRLMEHQDYGTVHTWHCSTL